MPVRMGLLYSHFVTSKTLLVVMVAALSLSCGRQPGVYAAPPQQSLDLGPDPGGLNAFVTMDDPVSDEYIVKDISPGRDFRRWALTAPELRFVVKEPGHVKFAADFTVPEVTYKVTGPVTVFYAVDGKKLGSLVCDHPGDFHVEKPVPEGWIEAGKQVHVMFQATPRWISPEDGAQLSFLLRSAGFTQ
uniref:Lipoprotein n=1 Tax=Solibacter usitatus (strain Ellin6076) TaxID=234267 RepID=Q01ZZ8_SOLUE